MFNDPVAIRGVGIGAPAAFWVATLALGIFSVGYVLDDSRVQLAVARDGLDLMRKLGERQWAIGLASLSAGAAGETGDWDWALELIAEFDQDDIAPQSRINLVVNRAIINGWRGNWEADAAALAALEPVIAGWTDPQWAATPTRYGSNRALAAGDPEQAYRVAMRGLQVAPGDVLVTTYSGALAARAALWMKDRARMADALSKVDAVQVRGGWVDTMRQTLHAGLLALEGRADEAVEGYVAAARRWRELEVWFELALSQFDFATTIGTDHSPAPPDLKHLESGDLSRAWGGISSLQISLPAVWTEARRRGFGAAEDGPDAVGDECVREPVRPQIQLRVRDLGRSVHHRGGRRRPGRVRLELVG